MKKNERFWDRVAKSEAKSQRLDKFDDDYKKTFEVLAKHLKPEHRVLDFACGTGKVSLGIADKVKSVQGIDLSSGMVEVAKLRAEQQGIKNVEFHHATIDDIRLEKGQFDVILACNILHLLDDPKPTITRIHQLLSSGGLFISSTGVLAEKRGVLTGLIWLLTKVGIVPKMHFYKTEQLKALIAQDFQIIDSAAWSGTFKDLMLVGCKG